MKNCYGNVSCEHVKFNHPGSGNYVLYTVVNVIEPIVANRNYEIIVGSVSTERILLKQVY